MEQQIKAVFDLQRKHKFDLRKTDFRTRIGNQNFPFLAVINFKNLEEAIEVVNSKNRPLALYIFSDNKQHQNKSLMRPVLAEPV